MAESLSQAHGNRPGWCLDKDLQYVTILPHYPLNTGQRPQLGGQKEFGLSGCTPVLSEYINVSPCCVYGESGFKVWTCARLEWLS